VDQGERRLGEKRGLGVIWRAALVDTVESSFVCCERRRSRSRLQPALGDFVVRAAAAEQRSSSFHCRARPGREPGESERCPSSRAHPEEEVIGIEHDDWKTKPGSSWFGGPIHRIQVPEPPVHESVTHGIHRHLKAFVPGEESLELLFEPGLYLGRDFPIRFRPYNSHPALPRAVA
jgi:hypothetical protein